MRSVLLHPTKKAFHSISSVANLCAALDITASELNEALLLPDAERYYLKSIPKSDGTLRSVHNPDHRIRRIQRRINKRILANKGVVIWPDHIFGSVPNHEEPGNLIRKDYVACARVHCRSKSILSLDIKDFFDNIHQVRVDEIFRCFFHYPEDVSSTLAALCCHNERVIQGALTSSYIASLALFDIEGKIVERLHRKNLRYTRLVDDITVSSTISDYDFSYAQKLVEDMLTDKELPINYTKVRTQYISSSPLTVHGLRVAFDQPRLPSNEIRNIRAAVQNIERLAGEPQYRMTHPYRRDFNRCMGRVNKLSRVGHTQHQNLVRRLRNVLPLPSRKDIERALKIIENLERDFALKSNSYWYSRRYHLAHERLNILSRTYAATATELRRRLKPIKPKYE